MSLPLLAAGLLLGEAHRLGVLLGASSVQSPHTINPELTREGLAALAARTGWNGPQLLDLLRS